MNKVILIGHAGKDSELIALTSGNTVTKFSMATTENYKDKNGDWQKKTEWHNIQIWNTKQEVKKGDLVCVEGKLTTQKKNDIYYTSVTAQKVKMLSMSGKKNEDLDEDGVGNEDMPF